MIETVAVVSGGAASEALQAVEAGVDLFITGESSHTIYHTCLEAGLNVLFGGHYQTETGGVQGWAERTARDTGLETRFFRYSHRFLEALHEKDSAPEPYIYRYSHGSINKISYSRHHSPTRDRSQFLGDFFGSSMHETRNCLQYREGSSRANSDSPFYYFTYPGTRNSRSAFFQK